MSNFNFKQNQEIYDLFFSTMFERHLVWYNRFVKKQEQPYTEDKIFQTTKFTNIYRELDRNTQWEIKNVLFDKSLDLKQMVWKLLLFRTINNINTFNEASEKYGWKNGLVNFEDYNADVFYNFLEDLKQQGKVAFTSSYLVYNGKGVKRNEFYAKIFFPNIIKNLDNIISKCQTSKNANDILKYLGTFEGIGKFNAYQLYIDLTYIEIFSHLHLFNFKKDDTINIGPGSTVGSKLIYPDIKPKDVLAVFNHLKELTPIEFKRISEERNIKFPYILFSENGISFTDECTITITEIEHWLCEFQKYYGVLSNTGKSRSKFKEAEQNIIVNINE